MNMIVPMYLSLLCANAASWGPFNFTDEEFSLLVANIARERYGDENFWNGNFLGVVAEIVLYRIAPGLGPGIVHAAIRFSRSRSDRYLLREDHCDYGWDRNGYYMRKEKAEPIDTLMICAWAHEVWRALQEVRNEWRDKSYNMLEDNCTDFVDEVIQKLGDAQTEVQFDKFRRQHGLRILPEENPIPRNVRQIVNVPITGSNGVIKDNKEEGCTCQILR